MNCPYAKSDMTPCVLRDGDVCYAMGLDDKPVCVGCGRAPHELGREPPADWEETVAQYNREHERDKDKL